jgi:hypothetical protein
MEELSKPQPAPAKKRKRKAAEVPGAPGITKKRVLTGTAAMKASLYLAYFAAPFALGEPGDLTQEELEELRAYFATNTLGKTVYDRAYNIDRALREQILELKLHAAEYEIISLQAQTISALEKQRLEHAALLEKIRAGLERKTEVSAVYEQFIQAIRATKEEEVSDEEIKRIASQIEPQRRALLTAVKTRAWGIREAMEAFGLKVRPYAELCDRIESRMRARYDLDILQTEERKLATFDEVEPPAQQIEAIKEIFSELPNVYGGRARPWGEYGSR